MPNFGTFQHAKSRTRYALSFHKESKQPRQREMSDLTWLRVGAQMKQILGEKLSWDEKMWLEKPIWRTYVPEDRRREAKLAK